MASRPLLSLFIAVLHTARAGLCKPHDDSDVAVSQCQEWCHHASHCSYCKCNGCSLCKACLPKSFDDSKFESCEPWCVGGKEHCALCKCKGCDTCKGHHPDRSCSPFDDADTVHEDCQKWCGSPDSCKHCKCKGCKECGASGVINAAPAQCNPRDRSDTTTVQCHDFCAASNAAIDCRFCKCSSCGFCPRCSEWCSTHADCISSACHTCPLCKGIAPAAPRACAAWCQAHHCGRAGGACDDCLVCGAPQRPPPLIGPPPPPPPPSPPPIRSPPLPPPPPVTPHELPSSLTAKGTPAERAASNGASHSDIENAATALGWPSTTTSTTTATVVATATTATVVEATVDLSQGSPHAWRSGPTALPASAYVAGSSGGVTSAAYSSAVSAEWSSSHERQGAPPLLTSWQIWAVAASVLLCCVGGATSALGPSSYPGGRNHRRRDGRPSPSSRAEPVSDFDSDTEVDNEDGGADSSSPPPFPEVALKRGRGGYGAVRT